MDLRLQETLAEAKRHYQSYMDIREQYNTFVDGRLNRMYKLLTEGNQNKGNTSSRGTPGPSSG